MFSSIFGIIKPNLKSYLQPYPFTRAEHSFVLSYLTNVLGMPLKFAQITSSKINFDTQGKPDDVVAFLEKRGFSKTDIWKIVMKRPALLRTNPTKTLKPKFDFLQEVGFSQDQLKRLFCFHPPILHENLIRTIVPVFNYVKETLNSQADAVNVISRCGTILVLKLETILKPNLDHLEQSKMPLENIRIFFKRYPNLLARNCNHFIGVVENLKALKIDPRSKFFIEGLRVLCIVDEDLWTKKMEAYKKWGFSEDETLLAFKKNALIMVASIKKMDSMLGFFVKEVGCSPSILLECPNLMNLSIEKTFVPRNFVYKTLESKGLLLKRVKTTTIFSISKWEFYEKFIHPFEGKIGGLLKTYEEMSKETSKPSPRQARCKQL